MPNSERWYSNPTQVFWTCDALTRGRVISHKTEIREVKGWRLGAIIHRLKSAYGWPIVTELRGPENIAHYRLALGTDLAGLRYPPSAQALADRLEGGRA
ncbi:hypothetical protein E4191_08095 [Paracoccus liaowanqingii]|uniref:Uncharacterized protein n=1 Tax=Paracoccus liaowanqingii TaxID=2560053 RepID=A0A4P7HKH4_9RHOB|nr:hypothetical protein [Paracoccus liaowanqingii]QBX34674.1 hypothetical protein E4191_08095 [Paracoccus liaowanqingii]